MTSNNTSGQQLGDFRDRIDSIDQKILALMNDRLEIAKSIAEIKSNLDHPVYFCLDREALLLRRLQLLNKGLMSKGAVESLFREIISITRETEKGLSVSVLGPRGTFSEAAARQQFGSKVKIIDSPTIHEVFRATESGHTSFSVVPVENSTEGGVSATLDRLYDTDLTICGEIKLQVHHCLLSSESDIGDIRQVYAHTQALGQCRRWMEKNLLNVKRVPVSSNADAALKASGEAGTAAIAGESAADYYGTGILARNIEDESVNTTRFLVLSRWPISPTGNDKTSLILAAVNKPGALVHLLQILLEEGIDMTRLESRPVKSDLWQYMFYIDFFGHQEDDNVAKALKNLKSEAGKFKNLGSYPVSS